MKLAFTCGVLSFFFGDYAIVLEQNEVVFIKLKVLLHEISYVLYVPGGL